MAERDAALEAAQDAVADREVMASDHRRKQRQWADQVCKTL